MYADLEFVYLSAIFWLNQLKKTNFLLKCKVIFQRNECVKGHGDLKWFLSLFQNYNKIFISIELKWNYWNISFKITITQYTQEKIEFNANGSKIQISIYRNRCQLPITGIDWLYELKIYHFRFMAYGLWLMAYKFFYD